MLRTLLWHPLQQGAVCKRDGEEEVLSVAPVHRDAGYNLLLLYDTTSMILLLIRVLLLLLTVALLIIIPQLQVVVLLQYSVRSTSSSL